MVKEARRVRGGQQASVYSEPRKPGVSPRARGSAIVVIKRAKKQLLIYDAKVSDGDAAAAQRAQVGVETGCSASS